MFHPFSFPPLFVIDVFKNSYPSNGSCENSRPSCYNDFRAKITLCNNFLIIEMSIKGLLFLGFSLFFFFQSSVDGVLEGTFTQKDVIIALVKLSFEFILFIFKRFSRNRVEKNIMISMVVEIMRVSEGRW